MNKPDKLYLGKTEWKYYITDFDGSTKYDLIGNTNPLRLSYELLINMGAVEAGKEQESELEADIDCAYCVGLGAMVKTGKVHVTCKKHEAKPEQDEELSELKLEKLPESCTTIFDLATATGVLKRNENKTTNHVNKLTRIVKQLQKERGRC